MKVLDLFSGLGGWSEAFISHGCEVIRVENNPLLEAVPNTQLYCVKELRDYLIDCHDRGLPIQKPDVILASPPCYEFSNAFNAPKSEYRRKHGTLEGYDPDLSLLQATIDIIELVKPRYYIIENVVGATRYFEKYLGKPQQIIGAFVLWGKFPKICLQGETIPTKSQKDKRHDPLRSNYKAKIPIQISRSLLTGILQQKTVFDY